MSKSILMAALAAAALALPSAQQERSSDKPPQFEVASIKPNKSGDPRVMIGMQPGGRFTATNVPLRMLIRNAFQLQETQLVGGPGWVGTEHFDIVAKADGNPLPVPPGALGPMQVMMRNLLKDRFKLVM